MNKTIKDRRKEKKLTQSEVAKAVGVSVNAYQHWERGTSQPNEENAKKLNDVLNK